MKCWVVWKTYNIKIYISYTSVGEEGKRKFILARKVLHRAAQSRKKGRRVPKREEP